MQTLVVVMCLSWALALVATPAVIRLATARGWLDRPGGRKDHAEPVAMGGGVAVFVSMFAGIGLAAAIFPPLRGVLIGDGTLPYLAAGILAIVAVGLYDDLYDMAPGVKAFWQLAIAAATWAAGFQTPSVELPFEWMILSDNMGVVSFVLTVGWIFIVTNAFNLLDGMDGLAAGISIVGVLTVFLLANSNGATVPVVACLALAGALAGFLRFNLPPARIFLGDAGAMAIGYATAVLSVAAYQKGPTAVALIVPLLVLGLPLADTILAMVRRPIDYLRRSGRENYRLRDALRSIVRPDRGHIHYLLLRSGLSVQATLFTLYAVSGVLATVGYLTRGASSSVRWGLWVGLLLVGYGALRLLERRVQRREEAHAASAPERPSEPLDHRAAS